ncbi:MAG: spondin domain-containing protein [Planctomycetota bacterium]
MERRRLLASDVLQINIEHLADPGGLAATPFWVAAHDGTFEIGRSGEAASDFPGLEALAEDGDVSGVVARFASDGVGNDAVITAPDGFLGAPVFEAGETVTETLTVDDTEVARYFSYASMVIPSNDAFIANLNSTAIELYDETGAFLGPRTITIYGDRVWDAGTEVNDPAGGAAFSTEGGTSTDENGVIMLHAGLDDFVGTGLPTGSDLEKAFSENTPIARITISQNSAPSNPIDAKGPRVSAELLALEQRADTHTVTVTYSDPSGIDPGSITTDNLQITGPLLTRLEILSVTTDAAPGTTPNEVTAVYEVSPTSGSFTALDNGFYQVELLANQVSDTLGQAAEAVILGDLEVNAPTRLYVQYENLADLGGLSQTPVWFGVHEGNFEVARGGRPASEFPGLELIAEEGDVSELVTRFQSESNGSGTLLTAPDGFAGAPVFEPGEVVTSFLDVNGPDSNRFLSFASMVIPSNDAFIANLDPRAYELFDAAGNFNGARTITIYGQDIWDAGTEVNDPNGGAAFSTEGGTSTDESGVIHRHEGLDDFIGTGLPTGETLGTAFTGMTPIGRITISMADPPLVAADNSGPNATVDVADLNDPTQSTHEIRVTYSDASGVDLNSIDVEDVRILGTNGEQLDIISATVEQTSGASNRVVTAVYEVMGRDGEALDIFDNGLYFVELQAGKVNDGFGNDATASSLGSFEILLPVQLEISIENLAVEGGLAQTPFWLGIHDGNFEVARAGRSAADFPGLEAIAEEGDASELIAHFAATSDGFDTLITAPDGFAGAPVFEPGEQATGSLNVFATNEYRYLSFASMVIPSNDAFLANLNPRAYEIFDANGFFLGEQTITLTGRDVWDAGTEVNQAGAGAAFSALGGDGIDEGGVIRRHDGLDEFIGTGLPTGEDLLFAFDPSTPLARITVSLVGGTSNPVDESGPTAQADTIRVETAGTDTIDVTVTYTDPSGVDLTTIGVDDLAIIGPLGTELSVIDAVVDPTAANGAQTVDVTYVVTTNDGPFTARDNGDYAVQVVDDAVEDTLGQGTETDVIGGITVDVGVRLEVEITSLTPLGGLAQTPFWIGFHEGGFEVARGGVSADLFGGLELIAEEGDASELAARFAAESGGVDTVITSPAGFAGAPVFEPGETASGVITVDDSQLNRYFSFASMIIPSNDAFVANRNARQYELFDSLGNFQGARRITLYGRDILDAGTEANVVGGGAAFSTEGGASVDEDNVIRRHPGLDDFIGTGLPTGENLQSAFGLDDAIAEITIRLVDPEAEVCSGVHGACSVRSVSLQNAALTSDVNRDGRVSALDALLVINFLNEFGSVETIADEAQATGLSLDVGDDGLVSARDALLVINELNLIAQSRSQPEAEPVDAVFATLGGLDEDADDDETTDRVAGQLF